MEYFGFQQTPNDLEGFLMCPPGERRLRLLFGGERKFSGMSAAQFEVMDLGCVIILFRKSLLLQCHILHFIWTQVDLHFSLLRVGAYWVTDLRVGDRYERWRETTFFALYKNHQVFYTSIMIEFYRVSFNYFKNISCAYLGFGY